IWRCVKCRTGFFPQRLLCSHCHGDTFEEDRVYEAVVEEISTIRHMLGQTDWQPRRIASVRTSDGQRITVALTDESEPGSVIRLFEENAAPFGAEKKWEGARAAPRGHFISLPILPRLFPRRVRLQDPARGVRHRRIDHAAVDGGRGTALRQRLVERLQHARVIVELGRAWAVEPVAGFDLR